MRAGEGSTSGWGAHAPAPAVLSQISSKSRRWDVAACLLLGLVFFLIYNANWRSIGAGDTYPARYLPFSIWKHHSLALDPIAPLVAQGMKVPAAQGELTAAYWMVKGPRGHLVSLYPVVTPVVVAPLYLPAVAYLNAKGWDPQQFDHVARIMEKLSASLLASASTMVLYLLLRRRSPPGIAALLTIAFALGTTTWVISSQALWMHGLGELLVVALLYLLTGPCTPWRAVGAGFICALLACNRQPDAILAAGFAIYSFRWAGRRVPLFLAAAAVPVSLVLAYNLFVVGHILGGYGLLPFLNQAVSQFGEGALTGLGGLLFSPVYGLFVFSPFLLFVPLCLLSVLRDPRWRGLTIAAGGALVVQWLFYGLQHWVQGGSWGPRYFTEALPILMWMLPPVLAGLPTAGRVVFAFACAAAIGVQTVGAFWYTGEAFAAAVAAQGPNASRAMWERAAWDVRNTPFVTELRHARVAPDLGMRLRGRIDVAQERDAGRGHNIEIAGWALMNSRTPADVTVVIDGQTQAGGTGIFFERPDVGRELGESSPSGWRVTFPADTLSPGEHRVTALVRAHAGGQPRVLEARSFTVTKGNRDRELAAAARHAAAALTKSQDRLGYWLTAYSAATQFTPGHREMDVFTNALLIDVIEPMAEATGLAGVVERAREFLSSQIESTGLVRYHGRPDMPTIGVMGCVITPDADDTALAWRVAPSDRLDLRALALATLKQFRTPDGLYQTWLATRDRYACIDPGKDPNPADIGIQLHVYLMLAQADPPSARALCEALQKRSRDESLWVYYRLAPPVVLLRLNDVRKAGCPLELPPARLQTTIAGQQVWLEVLDHLRRFETTDDRAAGHSEEAAVLLSKLATDGFSSISRVPPLLYHNDLSATVSRFYWSEELGYALWLRLYHQNELARSALSRSADASPGAAAGKAKP